MPRRRSACCSGLKVALPWQGTPANALHPCPVNQTAFQKYERQMRAFVALNQELAVKSAKLMRPKEQPLSTWLLQQIMRIAPGRIIEFFIERSTRRIQRAANAIMLKDYGAEPAARRPT